MTEKPLSNLGPHPGPNAALERRLSELEGKVISLEASRAAQHDLIASLEAQFGSAVEDVGSISDDVAAIGDAVHTLLKSLRR